MSDFKNKRLIKFEFDHAGTDSAGVSNSTTAAHPTGVFIPDNAIITDAFYEVSESFTSTGGDAGTLALNIEGAGDLVAATAVGAATVWGAGIKGTLAGSLAYGADAAHDTAIEVAALKAATYVKVGGQEEVTFTVGNAQTLSAGHLTLFIEYVVGL